MLFKINFYVLLGFFMFLLIECHNFLEAGVCCMFKIDFDVHDSFVCDSFISPNSLQSSRLYCSYTILL